MSEVAMRRANARADLHGQNQKAGRNRVRSWGGTMALVACVAQVGACARNPERVDARYVSPTMYQNWSCEQLVDERGRLTGEVQRVSGLQRENANADAAMMAVGVIIFWPALLGLAATKDRQEELGRLKGEYEAVDVSMKTKQCSLPPPATSGAPAVPSVAAVPGASVVPNAPLVPVAAASDAVAVISGAAGTYKGAGKTDAWCQSPTMALTIKGDTVTGQLSEIASGAATSAVTGTIDTAGVVGLDFKGTGANYFSGRVDGVLKDNVINVDFRSKTATACTYHFQLQKG